jgi:hypothetical protein
MRKDIIIAFSVVVACGFAALAFFFYVVHYYTVPIATYVATSGDVGDVTVGESKQSILVRLKQQSFAPDPKPKECPKTWIELSTMSDTQRDCLLKTDRWEEGLPSTKALCPEHVNVSATLQFKDGKLASVTTVCRHPE